MRGINNKILQNDPVETKDIGYKDKISKYDDLVMQVGQAIEELNYIRGFFDCVDIPELIDYAIYREKAANARLSYLLQIARTES
jgi:hypothetical protein